MRGCLACWLNKFGSDFQSHVTADAVEAVVGGTANRPGAVILSAASRPEGRAWLSEQTAGLRNAIPEVPIVLVLDEADLAGGQETALTLGCQGFIPMSSSPEIAVAALRLVMAGGRYFPYDIAAQPWRPAAHVAQLPSPSLGTARLTPREQAVFKLLSEGLSNKLIARTLGLALSTVKIHVHHILDKLNVQNRTEVAIWGRVTLPPQPAKKPVERPSVQPIAMQQMR
jgi:DNA-binding NarL/FixJ family response regulator